MKNKELQNELQKFSDDIDVSIALPQDFVDRLFFAERKDSITYVECEFGVAIERRNIQLTPYYFRDDKGNIESEVTFRDPFLAGVSIGEGEYSANPGDYFTVGDDYVFEDRYLTCICEKDGWTKMVIVKENPTKADLREWKELAEKSIGQHIRRVYERRRKEDV